MTTVLNNWKNILTCWQRLFFLGMFLLSAKIFGRMPLYPACVSSVLLFALTLTCFGCYFQHIRGLLSRCEPALVASGEQARGKYRPTVAARACERLGRKRVGWTSCRTSSLMQSWPPYCQTAAGCCDYMEMHLSFSTCEQ